MNEIELKYDINTLNQAVEYNKSSGRFMIVPMHSGEYDLDTLEKAWEKFNAQHKQLRREADWKSLELFGITNQEHYEYLRNKCLGFTKIETIKLTDEIVPSGSITDTNLFELANIQSKDVKELSESKKLDKKSSKLEMTSFEYGYLLSENTSGIKRDIVKLKLSLYETKNYSESVKKENILYLEEKNTKNYDRSLQEIIKFNNLLNKFDYIIPASNTSDVSSKTYEYYKMLKPEEFEKYHGGICWDYVAYEADYFNKNFPEIKYSVYFIVSINDDDQPTHTFLLFKHKNYTYWFESSWKSMCGVYRFNNESEALDYICKELRKGIKNYKKQYAIKFNPLDKKLFGLNTTEYMKYMERRLPDKPRKEVSEPNKPIKITSSMLKENLLTIDNKKPEDGTIDNKIKVDYPALPPDELLDIGVFNNENYYAEYKALKIDDKYTTKNWFESYQKYCLGIQEQEFIALTQARHSKLIELCDQLSKDPNNNQLKQYILELGWNPEIPYTSENRNLMSKYTKTKLNEFYNEFSFIDVQGIEDIDYINEEMNEDNILYPVYIVLLSSKSAFGKVIKKVTDSIWTHGAVSFDTKMNRIYSYDREGFTYDNLEKYGKDSKISVHTIFLNKKDYIKMKTRLDYFIANKKKTHYGFDNVLNVVSGKVKNHDLNLICTEFVDKLFKFVGIDLTHKSSNLVTPEDMNKSMKRNKKIYTVYDGYTGNYNQNVVDKRVAKLQASGKVFRELFTDKHCERIINKYTIEPITEAKEFPVQFDKEGNLLIKNIKKINYNEEYNKSHKLLKEYEKTGNIEAMKYEIAKLWFMFHLLEKIKHDKVLSKEELKVINDSRARIYNDFQKYLKVIQTKEKDFEFNKYYEESPFSDSAYKFNASTLGFTKEFIKSLIF